MRGLERSKKLKRQLLWSKQEKLQLKNGFVLNATMKTREMLKNAKCVRNQDLALKGRKK